MCVALPKIWLILFNSATPGPTEPVSPKAVRPWTTAARRRTASQTGLPPQRMPQLSHWRPHAVPTSGCRTLARTAIGRRRLPLTATEARACRPEQRGAVVRRVGVAEAHAVVGKRVDIHRSRHIRPSSSAARACLDGHGYARRSLIAGVDAVLARQVCVDERPVANVAVQIPALRIDGVLVSEGSVRRW